MHSNPSPSPAPAYRFPVRFPVFLTAGLLICALALVSDVALSAPQTTVQKTGPLAESSRTTTGAMPKRGMSMRQVEQQFGKPLEVLPHTGPTSKLMPPITRWVYDDFIVFFERDLVIHSTKPRDPEKFRKLKETAPLAKPVTDSASPARTDSRTKP